MWNSPRGVLQNVKTVSSRRTLPPKISCALDRGGKKKLIRRSHHHPDTADQSDKRGFLRFLSLSLSVCVRPAHSQKNKKKREAATTTTTQRIIPTSGFPCFFPTVNIRGKWKGGGERCKSRLYLVLYVYSKEPSFAVVAKFLTRKSPLDTFRIGR